MQTAKTAIDKDFASLSRIQTAAGTGGNLVDAIPDIQDLATRWKAEPGLVAAIRVVREIADAVLKGQIGAIFDFRQLKDLLEEQLATILPTRFDLNYDWDAEVSQFPESDPVFAIDRSADLDTSEDKINDLVLRTKVSVNVLTGERSVSAVGHLRPFKLRLIGSRMDLATIYFKGASFTASDELLFSFLIVSTTASTAMFTAVSGCLSLIKSEKCPSFPLFMSTFAMVRRVIVGVICLCCGYRLVLEVV